MKNSEFFRQMAENLLKEDILTDKKFVEGMAAGFRICADHMQREEEIYAPKEQTPERIQA